VNSDRLQLGERAGESASIHDAATSGTDSYFTVGDSLVRVDKTGRVTLVGRE
jgi:hypothetical protein